MDRTQETPAWKDYQNGLAWQRAMGFAEDLPLYVRFKEGDQWPPATRRTKNLPRPVFNMIEMFIRAKRAAVLDQPICMACRPAQSGTVMPLAAQGAQSFTEYARQLWKRLGQDELNNTLVDDAATEGTGILHYYWDTAVHGSAAAPFVGEVRGEALDPLAVIFADPQLREVQKQEWLLISQRLPLEQVRSMARTCGASEAECAALRADSRRPEYDGVRDVPGDERVTVLTRYFRRNGEVWFEKSLRESVLQPARPLTPVGSTARMRLYPVVLLPWQQRKRCIYGIGEAEGLLPSQKALNYNMAMLLLSVQQTGWPKLITRPNALRQPVTNEPGEILVDHWTGGGDGVRYLQAPAVNGLAAGLSEKVLELSREISGVSQVTTGDVYRANLAAAAIIAMQNQARTPIRETQRRFWRAVEQVGSIWLEFFRCYYSTPRTVTVEQLDENGSSLRSISFVGTDYAGIDFEMTVDVGASSEYSEVLSQTTLDKMLEGGFITIDQYVELSGPNVVPFRERFKQMRRMQQTDASAPAGTQTPLETPAVPLP